MKTIIYKQKGFVIKNPPPLLIEILRLKMLREEVMEYLRLKVFREAKKIDKEFMKK